MHDLFTSETQELIYSSLNFFKAIFFKVYIYPYHQHKYKQFQVVALLNPVLHLLPSQKHRLLMISKLCWLSKKGDTYQSCSGITCSGIYNMRISYSIKRHQLFIVSWGHSNTIFQWKSGKNFILIEWVFNCDFPFLFVKLFPHVLLFPDKIRIPATTLLEISKAFILSAVNSWPMPPKPNFIPPFLKKMVVFWGSIIIFYTPVWQPIL
jgi:hypothetical protein